MLPEGSKTTARAKKKDKVKNIPKKAIIVINGADDEDIGNGDDSVPTVYQLEDDPLDIKSEVESEPDEEECADRVDTSNPLAEMAEAVVVKEEELEEKDEASSASQDAHRARLKMSKVFLEEFIELFRNEPALWQSKSDNYKNKIEKNKSWENLLLKYKEIDKDATVETVKKKVNSLRTVYRRELQKVRKSEKSGAGTEDIYVPSLWYFDNLEFLRDQEIQADGFTTFDNSVEIEKNTTKKRKMNEVDFLQRAVEHLEKSSTQPQRDEADIYGEAWAATFRKLSSEQQIFAKRLMDEALMHGQLNQLTYKSSINFVHHKT